MAAHGTYKYSTYDIQDGDVDVRICDVQDDDGRCQIVTLGDVIITPPLGGTPPLGHIFLQVGTGGLEN